MAKKTLPYRCPQCGKIHDYPVYDGVDVSKEPQFRAKVMDASIFDFVCPHCGAVNGVIYPFLYHDPSHRFMVQLVDSTMPEDPFTDLFRTEEESEHAIRSVIEDIAGDRELFGISQLIADSERGRGAFGNEQFAFPQPCGILLINQGIILSAAFKQVQLRISYMLGKNPVCLLNIIDHALIQPGISASGPYRPGKIYFLFHICSDPSAQIAI